MARFTSRPKTIKKTQEKPMKYLVSASGTASENQYIWYPIKSIDTSLKISRRFAVFSL